MKSYLNFQLPLGSVSLPFGPVKCPWIGAAIGAAAAIGSAIINASSQNSANSANAAINQQNLDESARQFDTNLNWLQDQFKMERKWSLEDREYNEPSNQVARLRAAGINPAFAFGQGNMQTPQVSSVGASPGHVPSPIPMQASTFDLNGVGQAVNAFFQNQFITEQTKKVAAESYNIELDNKFKAYRELADLKSKYVAIEEALSRKHVNDTTRAKLIAEKDVITRQLKLFDDTYEEQQRSFKLNNDVLESQAANLDSQALLNKVNATLAPSLARSQIALNSSQSSALNAQLPLIAEQVVNARKEGVKLDYNNVRSMVENQLLQNDAEWKKLKHDAKTSSKAAKVFYGTLDLLTESLVGNLKLFAK